MTNDKPTIYLVILFWGSIIAGIIVGFKMHNWWLGSGIILVGIVVTVLLCLLLALIKK